MKKKDLIALIKNPTHREKLGQAIDRGRGTDWVWDGENENEVPIFNTEPAIDAVIEAIEEIIKT